jgi:hypothetical protein
MIPARAGNAGALVIAAALFGLALAAWQWRARVFQTERGAVDQESWGGIREEFPLPDESRPALIGLAPAAIDGTVEANPFAPLRRQAPDTPAGTGGGEGGQAATAQPQFIYKGRIMLGSRQRAVVENVATRKTHFLEVGQEVAGLKVLDIAENQVLLSDPRTGSEVVLGLKQPAGSP